MKLQRISNGLLILAAMIWGAAFVAQSAGMDYVGPLTFLACRSVLGSAVLLPVIAVLSRRVPAAPPTGSRRDLWLGGSLCGVILFISATLQQVGLLYTTAGKSAFVTALYVVLVPLCSVLLGRRFRANLWISAVIAAAALYLLCLNESLTVGPGELLTLACALCFAIHILIIDHFSSRVDGVKLSCIQFAVCAVLAWVAAFLWESPSWNAIVQCWLPIGYAGILSSGVAFTLQIVAQKYTKPAVASLLMSLESFFAVLFGAVLLHERLSLREYAGCVLMFGAIVLAQLPARNKQAQ